MHVRPRDALWKNGPVGRPFDPTVPLPGEATDNPGFLRIKTRDGDVNALPAYTGMPLQRIDLKRFDAETAVTFDARSAGEAAGLILHSTAAFNVMLSLTRTDSGKVIELASFTNATNRTDGAQATRNTIAAVPFHGTSAAGHHLMT